jgi:hypothetical protein
LYFGLITFALVGAATVTSEPATWELAVIAAAGYVLVLLIWRLWRKLGHRP